MKSVLVLVLLFTALPARSMTSRVGAAEDMGIGAAAGQPFGLTAKYWTSATTAWDGFIGYHWNRNFDLHGDYLWHSFSSFNVSEGRMPFYIGVGARLNAGDDTHLGARFPLGVSYLSPSSPIEYFVQIAPILKVIGDFGGLDLDGQIGFRVYLNYLR